MLLERSEVRAKVQVRLWTSSGNSRFPGKRAKGKKFFFGGPASGYLLDFSGTFGRLELFEFAIRAQCRWHRFEIEF